MLKGILVTIFGIIVLILGEVILLRMKKCKDEAFGKVVGIVKYTGNIKWSLFTTLNLTIEYNYNGTDMRAATLNAITCITSNIDKKLSKKGCAIGDQVSIKVNPADPKDICTEYKRSFIVTLGGILITLLGILMIKSGY